MIKRILIGLLVLSINNVYALDTDIQQDNNSIIDNETDKSTENNEQKDSAEISEKDTEDDQSQLTTSSEEPITIIKNGLVVEEGKTYFYENDKKIYGFRNVGEDLYFFSSKDYAASQGWKAAYGNVWYQNEEGKVVRGLQIIDGKKYYFNEQTGYQEIGFKNVENDLYFFSCKDKAASQGWKAAYGNVWYQNEEGKVVRGLQIVDGKKYYFNEQTGYQEIGFKNVGNDLCFFSCKDKTASQGWKAAYGKIWYQDENGIVLKDGWHTINNKQYYVKDNYVLRGIKNIEKKDYFFDVDNGALLTGFINYGEKTYYAGEDNSLVKSYQTINKKEYYFNSNFEMVKGLVKINGKLYYYNSNTGEKMYGSFSSYGNQYTINSKTGEVIKVQYIPRYYNQKDNRWSYIKYGRSSMGNTGCAPTSMAMAYTSILEREILPPTVADYLYYETNEYNKKDSGTSGLGIIYASNKFNVNIEKINTKTQLINALSQGKIVFAAMSDGKFATKKWNHAILVYSIEGNNVNTISADPLNQLNNGLVPIDTVWREQSKDQDDTQGGAALYALSPKIKEITE